MQLHICIFSTLAAVGLGVRKPAKVMGQQCYELWSWEKRKHANDLWRLDTAEEERETGRKTVSKYSSNQTLGVHLFELAFVVLWYLCVYDSFIQSYCMCWTLALWMHRWVFVGSFNDPHVAIPSANAVLACVGAGKRVQHQRLKCGDLNCGIHWKSPRMQAPHITVCRTLRVVMALSMMRVLTLEDKLG